MSTSSSSSSSSSGDGRVILEAGDTYTYLPSHAQIRFKFMGSNGTYATIILVDTPFVFKVANVSNKLVWDYQDADAYTFTTVNETIKVPAENYVFKVRYDGAGSLLFTIIRYEGIPYETIYVAMACRSYGEGRVLIHTDRLGAIQTGHGENDTAFWRNILDWTAKKSKEELIKVGLIINTKVHAAEKLHSVKPISITNISLYDLSVIDISSFDCLYMVGLPEGVTTDIADKIASFVESGKGLIIEYPNRGGEYINVLSSIESLYCYSSERPTKSLAYWTLDGINHDVYYEGAKVAFMSTLRQADFSTYWTILMTNVVNLVTTTTTTYGDGFHVLGQVSSEFGISYISAMQNGIVTLEQRMSSESSSSTMSSSSSS